MKVPDSNLAPHERNVVTSLAKDNIIILPADKELSDFCQTIPSFCQTFVLKFYPSTIILNFDSGNFLDLISKNFVAPWRRFIFEKYEAEICNLSPV